MLTPRSPAVQGIGQLRKSLRKEKGSPLPLRSASPSVALDAALSGCVSGFLCGQILVGPPKFMALAGAVSFAMATRWPEPSQLFEPKRRLSAATLRPAAGQLLVGCAYRGSRGMARLRASVGRLVRER